MSDPVPSDPPVEEVVEIPEPSAAEVSEAAAFDLAASTLAELHQQQALEAPRFRQSQLYRGLWGPRNRAGEVALDEFSTANPQAKLADFQAEILRLRGIHGD